MVDVDVLLDDTPMLRDVSNEEEEKMPFSCARWWCSHGRRRDDDRAKKEEAFFRALICKHTNEEAIVLPIAPFEAIVALLTHLYFSLSSGGGLFEFETVIITVQCCGV